MPRTKKKSAGKPAKTEAKVQSEPETTLTTPTSSDKLKEPSNMTGGVDKADGPEPQAAEPEAPATPEPEEAQATPTPSPAPGPKPEVKEVRVNIKLTEDLYQIYQKEAQDHAMPTASLMAYALKEYADANFCDAFPALDAAQVAAAAAIAAQMMGEAKAKGKE